MSDIKKGDYVWVRDGKLRGKVNFVNGGPFGDTYNVTVEGDSGLGPVSWGYYKKELQLDPKPTYWKFLFSGERQPKAFLVIAGLILLLGAVIVRPWYWFVAWTVFVCTGYALGVRSQWKRLWK